MRVLVMGAGGVGCFFGGRLARGGMDVTLVARGAHLEALRRSGLRIESAVLGELALPRVQAASDPATAGPVELVLLTTKAYDLEPALRAVLPALHETSVVIPFQNGVDMAERAGAIVGAERVMAGVARVSAHVVAPGVVRHTAFDRLVFGEPGGGLSARGEAIRAALAAAGLNAVLSADIRAELWRKFVQNTAAAGVPTLARRPLGAVLGDTALREVFCACMRETEAVGRALGVALPPDICEAVLRNCESAPAELKPSMLVDLERGKRFELDNVNGTVVRLGRARGIPTPVNAVIYAALKPHAAGPREDSAS